MAKTLTLTMSNDTYKLFVDSFALEYGYVPTPAVPDADAFMMGKIIDYLKKTALECQMKIANEAASKSLATTITNAVVTGVHT